MPGEAFPSASAAPASPPGPASEDSVRVPIAMVPGGSARGPVAAARPGVAVASAGQSAPPLSAYPSRHTGATGSGTAATTGDRLGRCVVEAADASAASSSLYSRCNSLPGSTPSSSEITCRACE